MKVCWFGIYRKEYPRNDILMEGLRQNGVQILECNAGGMERFRYLKLIWKLLKLRGEYDLVYAGYPSQLSTIVAKIFSRQPVAMDAFFSMYDAMVYDRQEIAWWKPRALKFLILDWLSVLAADMVIADTEGHKKFWAGWKWVNPKKVKVVYIGVNDKQIKPEPAKNPFDKFLVQFHGNYIPLQGIRKVAEAAEILKNDPSIKFRLIGWGQQYQETMDFIRDRKLDDIALIGRIPFAQMNPLLNEADVILGIFGETPKSDRVIPNKLFEGIAVAKPVITKDSEAIREVFSEDDICLIKNDSQSLVEAIVKLKNDPALRERIAQNGYKKYQAALTPKSLGRVLKNHLEALIK